jgi:4'-phosphopantetheinyl transferase
LVTVGLWQAPLDLGPSRLAEFERSLSPAERARAGALRGERLRARYVADHGWRRLLLAERLGLEPADVDYAISEHGKPEPAGGRLRFSASRSGPSALYAASEQAAVGVDLEQLRDDVDLDAMAGRFFSPGELAAREAISPQQRVAAGFACWTRKEAWAKAEGSGLVFPLAELEVWAGDDTPVRCGEFEVHAVDAGPGYAAAIAVQLPVGAIVSVPHKPSVMN